VELRACHSHGLGPRSDARERRGRERDGQLQGPLWLRAGRAIAASTDRRRAPASQPRVPRHNSFDARPASPYRRLHRYTRVLRRAFF